MVRSVAGGGRAALATRYLEEPGGAGREEASARSQRGVCAACPSRGHAAECPRADHVALQQHGEHHASEQQAGRSNRLLASSCARLGECQDADQRARAQAGEAGVCAPSRGTDMVSEQSIEAYAEPGLGGRGYTRRGCDQQHGAPAAVPVGRVEATARWRLDKQHP